MKKKDNSGNTLSAHEKAAVTRDLFERYRRGDTTLEENDIIESIEEEMIPEKDFEMTDDLIQEMDRDTKEFIFRQTGIKIESQKEIDSPKSIYSPRRVAKKRVLIPAFIGSIAGIFLLIIGIFIFYRQQSQQASLSSDLVAAPVSLQYISDTHVEHILLPDGSLIALNTATKVSLHEGSMSGATREIWLDEGEIFLDVKEDKSKPFVIHLRDGLTVEVVGTSFTIQSYKELPFQEISVLSGKVKVETSKGEEWELSPDQKAIYHASEKILTLEQVDSAQKASWRNGIVVLENASLDEFCFRMKQFYGKEIVFENHPGIMSVNITFDRKTSPEEIATEVAALYHLSYRITADQIIFFSQGT